MDFDPLSKHLINSYKPKSEKAHLQITAIDLCGRGHSDYVQSHSLYKMCNHLTECDDLLNHLRSKSSEAKNVTTSWIGTSYGGIIGMFYALSYYPTIKHLVLNDIGPTIPKQFVDGMRDFANDCPLTNDLDEMEIKLKEKYGEEYGPNVDWKQMAENSSYFDERCNKFKMNYDPNVCEGFLMDIGQKDGDWDIFDSVWKKIPKEVRILLIRGQKSTILTRETVDKMIATNSNTSVVEIEETGHHPLLCEIEEMDIIAKFLGLVPK